MEVGVEVKYPGVELGVPEAHNLVLTHSEVLADPGKDTKNNPSQAPQADAIHFTDSKMLCSP